MIVAVALALIAAVSAIGGVKDLAGNYYDLTTGQYSSSLTGKVYNTYSAPVAVAPVAHAPLVAPYAAAYAAPYAASYAAPYAAYSYGAPYPLAYGLLK